MCVASLIRHTSSLELSSGIDLFGDSQLQWLAISPEKDKTEAAVALDGLASCILYLGLMSKAGLICSQRNIRLHLAKWIL